MEKERKDSYSHVLKYTGIFGGVQGLNILISLVRNKCVAFLIGPVGIGHVALFNSVVNFVSQATNLGISFSAVRHISEYFDKGDEERMLHFINVVRAWSLLTALIGTLLCMMAGPLLGVYTFAWGDHTWHFVFLSPMVGMLAITGGETAILKGTRRLRSLAVIQLYTIIISLLITVPIYYFFGVSGIVPVMVFVSLASMLLTIRHSYSFYPLRLKGSKGILGEGMEMVRLGVAFVLAGIFGSGAEMLIRSYINVKGDLDVLGLYNAGFVLTVTYAGMVFSAMETDYFPRLSGCASNGENMSLTVNRQIEVSLLLVAPMLATLIVTLPVLMPLLFSDEFLPVVAMAQVAVFSMYIKAVSLPMSYMVLAKGDSLAYLCIEGFDSVLLVVFSILCYDQWGLWGMGIALDAFYAVDLVIIYAYTSIRYGYRASLAMAQIVFIQLPLGLSVFLLTFADSTILYWGMGSLLCFVSIGVSLYILHQKSSLWSALTRKVKEKFKHNE